MKGRSIIARALKDFEQHAARRAHLPCPVPVETLESTLVQTSCLIKEAGAGAAYMSKYDEFEPAVRQALQQAPYNYCAYCFSSVLHGYSLEWALARTKDKVESPDF